MIEANELRIGNWLLVNEDGPYVPMQLEFVGKNLDGFKGYSAHFKGRTVTLEDIYKDGDLNVKPVPLTIEMFLNSGFERYIKRDGMAFFHHEESGFEVGLEFDPQGNAYFYYWPETQNEFQLQGVHELQNLFYQLNYLKEELDIKL